MNFLKKYNKDAIIVQVMLDVNQKSKHIMHFFYRHLGNARRKKSKYLKYFKEIRLIRDYLVARAEKERVPVIENYNLRKAEKQILEKIISCYVHKK
jgi:2-phosphoglycerate kinase